MRERDQPPHTPPSDASKWDCAIGTPDEDHDWEFKSDWYGDPEVINGTADCSYWECRACGKEDHERAAPEYDFEDDYYP